jgi:ATP-dependent RNA helicase DeaD
MERLASPTHIVATPGRLIDLTSAAINLKETKFLVLDEADEMVSILKESLDEIVAEFQEHRTFFVFGNHAGDNKAIDSELLKKMCCKLAPIWKR